MRTALALVSVTIAAAAVTGPVGPASSAAAPSGAAAHAASHHRIVDPRHDVFLFREKPKGNEGVTRKRHVRNGDIRAVDVRYRPAAVRVTVHLAELRRPAQLAFTVVSLRTAEDTFNTNLFSHRSDPAPEVLFDAESGRDISCPAVRAKVIYAKAVIRVRVPRHCLGNPDWVRPSIAVINLLPGATGSLLADVAPGTRPRDAQRFGAKVFSPVRWVS